MLVGGEASSIVIELGSPVEAMEEDAVVVVVVPEPVALDVPVVLDELVVLLDDLIVVA
jgi:hypothetical protein